MAASRRTAGQRYRRVNAVEGNLARKLDSRELERRLESSGQLDFDRQYRRRQETEAERRSRQRAQAKAAVRPAQRVSAAAVLGFLSVAALMVGLLVCYARINAVSQSIVKMKAEISQLQEEQAVLLTQYERSFDLTTVKAAAESAGMNQPSESQIFYISLPGSDRAVAYGDSESEGLLGRLIRRISEYFR